jgi:hypothetical protein
VTVLALLGLAVLVALLGLAWSGLLNASVLVGCIALFPQALVPTC